MEDISLGWKCSMIKNLESGFWRTEKMTWTGTKTLNFAKCIVHSLENWPTSSWVCVCYLLDAVKHQLFCLCCIVYFVDSYFTRSHEMKRCAVVSNRRIDQLLSWLATSWVSKAIKPNMGSWSPLIQHCWKPIIDTVGHVDHCCWWNWFDCW